MEVSRKDLECSQVAAEDQGTGQKLLSPGLQEDTSPSVHSSEGGVFLLATQAGVQGTSPKY